MNIAKLIYDAYPFSSDLDIDLEKDLKDLDTLYNAVISKPVPELGDGLFRFIVTEITEGATQTDGTFMKDRAIVLMERAIAEIQCVIYALRKETR